MTKRIPEIEQQPEIIERGSSPRGCETQKGILRRIADFFKERAMITVPSAILAGGGMAAMPNSSIASPAPASRPNAARADACDACGRRPEKKDYAPPHRGNIMVGMGIFGAIPTDSNEDYSNYFGLDVRGGTRLVGPLWIEGDFDLRRTPETFIPPNGVPMARKVGNTFSLTVGPALRGDLHNKHDFVVSGDVGVGLGIYFHPEVDVDGRFRAPKTTLLGGRAHARIGVGTENVRFVAGVEGNVDGVTSKSSVGPGIGFEGEF